MTADEKVRPRSVQTTTLPFTVYAAALLYRTPTGGFVLCCEMLSVSGHDPLTDTEVLTRAREKADDPANTYVAGTTSYVVNT